MTELQTRILACFGEELTPAKEEAALIRELGGRRRTAGLKPALDELVAQGALMEEDGRYFRPALVNCAAGTLWDSGRKFAFVTPDGAAGRDSDIFLPPHCSGGAWHGDRVLVQLERHTDRTKGERPAGRVIRILRRANALCTGTLEKEGMEYYVRPDGNRLPVLKVAGGHSGLRRGDKVQAKILSYGGHRKSPLCQVVTVFGKSGTRQAAVEAILAQHGICREFPPEVLAEAEAAPGQVHPAARRGRLDLRGERIITIDGPYAKDLDDAVSLEPVENGWRLGVHIADVSHYVKEGSELDREAYRRGTSVYFADQVIPMLPVALSNGICSLNPRVERLTLSCIMELDRHGNVTDYTVRKSVIRTAERMTYPDCNALLKGEDGGLAERYAHILPMLRDMKVLSDQLAKNRKNRGALDLESGESVILCDENGAPQEVTRHESGESERIIESFMLIANETVAQHLVQSGLAGVFRIHENPTSEKLERLQGLLAPFGYRLETPDAFGMQKLLRAAEGTPEAPAVSMALLRSLMKARYEEENVGHFGLGAEYYCHFTSPIRRYPDLMVHRILADSMNSRPRLGHFRKAAAEAAAHSSLREVEAETAERDIEKCYLAEYMLRHVGEHFVGAVSGVTRNGIFVLLPCGAEGRIPVEALDGWYEYDEEAMTLTGGHPRVTYRFAMELAVQVAGADPGTGNVDLIPEGSDPDAAVRAFAAEKQPVPKSHGKKKNKSHGKKKGKHGGKPKGKHPQPRA